MNTQNNDKNALIGRVAKFFTTINGALTLSLIFGGGYILLFILPLIGKGATLASVVTNILYFLIATGIPIVYYVAFQKWDERKK